MLLRGFASKYMNSVYRGPEDEGGADADAGNDLGNDAGGDSGHDADPDDGGHAGSDEGDGGGQRKPLSIREELKRTIADAQKADEERNQQRTQKKSKEAKPAQAQGQQQEQQAAPKGGDVAPPASLAKELHAEWANAPKAIQEAFIKREQDMQRGVNELKERYSKIDEALAPHSEALRQMNATPAEAVNRMFLWFKALANSPAQAFPGLAQSLGFDWNRLIQAATQGGQQQQQDQGQQQQQQEVIPETVKNYIGQLEQRIQQLDGRFSGIQNDIQASNMAKTQENLSLWSKDKEFFQEVRQDMAALIQAGLIPPLQNGQVDLDTAYERAIHYNPEVRAKVLAKQQQANQEAQQQATSAATTARQQQTQKARKAASSIPAAQAPGQVPTTPPKKPGQRTSVRESLKAAIAELRDQQ
jgi:hypothetical protein